MAPGNLDKATESLEFVVRSAECNSPLDDSRSRSLTALKLTRVRLGQRLVRHPRTGFWEIDPR